MKHVKVVNDGDEAVVITLKDGREIVVEPGAEMPADDDVSIQLGTGNTPKVW